MTEAAAEFLASRLKNSTGREKIEKRASNVRDNFKNAKNRVDDRLLTLMQALEGKAAGDVDDALAWIKTKQDEMDAAEAPHVEPEKVKEQLKEYEVRYGILLCERRQDLYVILSAVC